MRAIVGGEHVGIAVQEAQPLDFVLLDEVRDLAALGGEDAPVIFAEGIFPPRFLAAGRFYGLDVFVARRLPARLRRWPLTG